MQREESPTMTTGLERIAAKARCEPKLRFTSLAHHITKERVWENLCQIPTDSAPGVDGQTVPEAKESFEVWIEAMLQSVHRQGYHAPAIRRVYIPKPGKQEKRPLGVPCVADRALQRSTAHVLSAIYEQGKVTPATRAPAFAGPDAANAALVDPAASPLPQSKAPWSLCIPRHCPKYKGTAAGASGRGTILAQNAEQPELERADLVGAIPADQGTVSAAATKAVSPLRGVASYRRAVNQLLTSVVREICTLRSVGAGERATAPGHPVGDQRWSSLRRQLSC